jgi:putative membrane protein
VLSTLATVAPAFYGGAALWPLFIIGHVIWFFLIVLFIVFLIVGVGGRRRRMARWGYGPWGGHGGWSSAARGAEATLAERFAQGDIDEKEYRARLEVLRANDASQQPPK